MAYLDRAVIALNPDGLPQWQTFVDEVLAPAGLRDGDTLGRVTLGTWEQRGDHAYLTWAYDGAPREPQLLLRPRDEADGAFLRTPRWNVSYLGEGFDAVAEALLREVARRLDAVCAARDLDATTLHARWFARPDAADYLEITAGKKLYLRVTDYCDENCVFCNATEGNANIVGSKAALRDILDRLPAGQLSQVIFSGGEPTLVKALPDYVAIAAERGAREIILQTNGVGLARPGALEAYLPWRDRVGIGFSLHAFDPDLSTRLTGAAHVPALPLRERYSRGLDEATLQAAARSQDAGDPGRSAVGAALRTDPSGRFEAKLAAIDAAVSLGFRVKITCVVTRLNVAQVPAFAETCWQRWGARLDRLQFSYAMPRGNAWLNAEGLLRFSDCVAPFASAFALGERTGLHVETSQTACMPPCVMPDHLDHFDFYGDFSGQVADDERHKPAAVCTGCVFDRLCPGVWTRYTDVHGVGELRAVTDRPAPQVALDDFVDGDVLSLEPR